MEQVFINLPLSDLEPIVKRWFREVQEESQSKVSLQEEKEKLLNIKQAAAFLNLTVPTIYSKVSKGELPNMKRGKRLYFSNSELLDYIKKGKRKSNEEIQSEANNYLNK